jgi:hypothetical protein
MSDDFKDDTDAPEGAGRVIFDVRALSAADLGRLGLERIAYVKPVMINGAGAFAIHAADGTPMAVAQDRMVALAAIAQHEMVPALVH